VPERALSNIRLISYWTSLWVWQDGKNIENNQANYDSLIEELQVCNE